MKKVFYLLAILFATSFVSCTDDTEEQIQQIENAQNINKEDSVNPGGNGQGHDDDNGEG